MAFNDNAIRAFGEENKNMSGDSSWHGLDEQRGRLQTYLDYQWIRRWYLNDKTTAGCNGSILDVGSGKGRMIRCLADRCNRIVGVEPYESFFGELNGLVRLFPNLSVHHATFADYATSTLLNNKFDLIYASGVTPYFDDEEFSTFFHNAKSLLSANGRIIVRELGSVVKNRYTSTQINRTSHDVIRVAADCGLACDHWGRAYPPFLTEWLYNRHPNLVTGFLHNLFLKAAFYPLWRLLSKLNLPTRFKLPRGQDLDYHVYLFSHSAPGDNPLAADTT